MPERLHALLPYALLAPSRHNTQPWIFEIEGSELRVYGDGRRALRVADPEGRALAMACGAAIHNVEVAGRHLGQASSVEILSGTRRDGLLARLVLEEPQRPRPDDHRLFDAIALRRTNRFGFDERPLPPGVVARLVRAASWLGVRVRPVDETLRPALAELVRDGDRLQRANPRFRAELAAWSRANDDAVRDGMPGYAFGLSDPASVLHRLLVRVGRGSGPDEERGRRQVLHSPALLTISTDGDRTADWFAAGRALQCVLLHATAEGLSASFFSQAVEEPAVRAGLRDTIGERGWPQLLLRIGYGRAVRATPRRPVEDVLRSSSSDAPLRAIVRAGDQGAFGAAGLRT